MKLPYTAVLTLFLNSAVSAKKTGAGDDHTMIRNLLAKVEAQDAKMAVYDAKIDELNEKNAKLEAQDAKIAKLEALLLGTPRVPQGKKNLRLRGLREDDANVDFAATLMDFATTGEKTEEMIAQLGLASVLKELIFKMDPVFNCLSYDKVSQTCTLGSDDTNNVDIIAEEDIDVRAVDGGDISIEAIGVTGDSGDVSIEADNVDIEANDDIIIDAGDDISLDASNDVTIGSGSNVTIEGDSGVDIKSDGGNINLDAFTRGTGPTAGGNINLGADFDIDIDAVGFITLETDDGDITLAAGNDSDDAEVDIRAKGDVDLRAGVDSFGDATNNGGDITLDAFAGTGATPPGGNVAVLTDGDGDFTVDGSTVLP